MEQSLLLIFNVFLYACIGMSAGAAYSYFHGLEGSLIYALPKSAAVGMIIGVITKCSILFLRRYVKALWALYALMMLIAGGLTLVVSYSSELREKIMILIIVESLALSTMYMNIRYFHRLNNGLKRKQAVLEKNRSSFTSDPPTSKGIR